MNDVNLTLLLFIILVFAINRVLNSAGVKTSAEFLKSLSRDLAAVNSRL